MFVPRIVKAHFEKRIDDDRIYYLMNQISDLSAFIAVQPDDTTRLMYQEQVKRYQDELNYIRSKNRDR